MKKIKNVHKSNLLKKIFIKICRILNFEIIDQANFTVPTLKKGLNESLSIPGKKSIVIPLGKIKIDKKIKSLKIILRTCTSELIVDQNKKRLFDQKKNEYTLRTLKSLIKSLEFAKKIYTDTKFEIIVTDNYSESQDISNIKNMLNTTSITTRFESINLENFVKKIKPGYSKGRFANMANFYTSLLIAKEEEADLVYFVEDDYIHTENAISEMLFSYEKFSTIFKNDIVLLPADYPYLYAKDDATKIYIGEKNHWRLVDESLLTFMTSKELILKNFNNLETMGIEWGDPYEKPLHDIYKINPCLSPIPSLAIHCANINSVYGLSPNINWKKIWDENSL